MKIRSIVMAVNQIVDKRAPEILTSFGVIGVVSTTGLGIKATIKSVLKIQETEKKEKRKLTNKESLILVWSYYLPTLSSAAITIASVIASNSVSANRLLGMSNIFLLTEEAFAQYKDKVVDMIGEKKAKLIEEDLNQAELEKKPVGNSAIILTGAGEHLCFDKLSGRYFKHDIEKLRRAQNDFNEQLFSDMYLTVNDWYYMIGLEGTDLGTHMGWDVQNGNLRLSFSAKLTDSGEPCIIIAYNTEPRYM